MDILEVERFWSRRLRGRAPGCNPEDQKWCRFEPYLLHQELVGLIIQEVNVGHLDCSVTHAVFHSYDKTG